MQVETPYFRKKRTHPDRGKISISYHRFRRLAKKKNPGGFPSGTLGNYKDSIAISVGKCRHI